MSKAFTRESEDDDEAPVAEPAPPPAKNYITPAGYARLKAELKALVEVERPEVVDSAGRDTDQVFFGATVKLKNKSITIVGIDETDTSKGRVSWISPVAKALIKAREGDKVLLKTPGGIEELEILEVRYDPID